MTTKTVFQMIKKVALVDQCLPLNSHSSFRPRPEHPAVSRELKNLKKKKQQQHQKTKLSFCTFDSIVSYVSILLHSIWVPYPYITWLRQTSPKQKGACETMKMSTIVFYITLAPCVPLRPLPSPIEMPTETYNSPTNVDFVFPFSRLLKNGIKEKEKKRISLLSWLIIRLTRLPLSSSLHHSSRVWLCAYF